MSMQTSLDKISYLLMNDNKFHSHIKKPLLEREQIFR